MKVLHLSTSDIRGGAARGAFWLHQALVEKGVDSRMLVGRKYSGETRVSALNGALSPLTERVRDRLDPLPLGRYHKTEESFWTLGWLPRRVSGAVKAIDPDVIHLHWTGGGFLPIGAFRDFDRPIVWTLRDMWGFTGGCHYSAGCERYAHGCGACPQLRSQDENDISRKTVLRKQRGWKDVAMTLVPISAWLADCVRRSVALRDRPIEIIPNGIDLRCFRPARREEALAAWNLSPDRRYILFGAIGALNDERKGFRQLAEATRILARDCWSRRAEILVFGGCAAEDTGDLALPVRFVGHIDDDRRLAELYAAADVMVAPSLQEAFGKTLIEAMACGTPVVAFDETGPADIVAHRETGYLAALADAADLASGIAWCLQAAEERRPLGAAARRRAESCFDINVVAGRYHDLYQRILQEAA